MSFLDTQHKKKSFTVTTLLLTTLLFLMFYIGLSYLDPPIENGISVNFGTTNFGSGNVQPKVKIKSIPIKERYVEKKTPIKEIPESTIPTEATEAKIEEVVTQNNEESVVLKKQKEAAAKEEAEKKAQLETERKERERKAEKERIKKEQEVKKKNLDAMMGGLNSSDGKLTGGEGNDNRLGDKGQQDGNPYAASYYGGIGGGSDSGGVGYGLNKRSLISGNKFVQDCNESGTVVVKIEVDRSGKVINVTPGVKGTTNTAPCLKDAASKTARSHKWNADAKAPSRQIGFVVVNFKLGE